MLRSCGVLALAAAHAAQSEVSVYYTLGANGMDIKNNTPTGSYNIARATFDASSGARTSIKNLTAINSLDMGYVSVDVQRNRVVFASQKQWTPTMVYNNVELLTVPLDAHEAKQAAPLLSASQATQLLSVCKGTGGPHGCNQMSQFSPHPGAASVLFAVRFWGPPPNGYAVGNQAIAVVRDDGSAEALTWSGSYAAQFTQDLCPRFVPGTDDGLALFARGVDSGRGETTTFFLVDVHSKMISELQIPALAGKTGCPHFIDAAPGEATFIYLSSDDAAPARAARYPRKRGERPEPYHPHNGTRGGAGMYLTAATLTLPHGAGPYVVRAENWWKVPLVDTPGWSGVPEFFQCAQLRAGTSAETTLACETANAELAVVNSTESAGGRFDKLATLRLPQSEQGAWCITADCFQALLTPARANAELIV